MHALAARWPTGIGEAATTAIATPATSARFRIGDDAHDPPVDAPVNPVTAITAVE